VSFSSNWVLRLARRLPGWKPQGETGVREKEKIVQRWTGGGQPQGI